RTALYVVIFGLLMTLASGVFTVVFPESVFLGNLGRVIGSVAELLATFLIIGGIGMIGAKLNDMGLQEKAGKLLGIIMTVIILRLIANIALLLFRESLAAFLVLVIGIMVLILSIVQYLLYLSLLSHAKNTLASH
ncbi:MAG: hypothetical protein J5819_07225, partial [Eubacterium sp.]|nr:hypothetical protein [Eubacterium sp.]